MSTLGERLKILRGTTRQAELAASLGMAQTTLSNYETGRNEPNIETIRLLVSHFDVNINWLLFGEGPIRGDNTPSNCCSEPVAPTTESSSLEEKTIPAKLYYAEREGRLEKAETKIETLEEERRELAAEVRKLYRDKEVLLRENGALRERLARFEAHQDQQASLGEDRGPGCF